MASAVYCWGCKARREITYTEQETGRDFCHDCMMALPPSNDELRMIFLMMTIPFKVGDRVEARTGATLFDGVGVVSEVSTSLEHGGTVVYPTFLVEIDDKAYPEAPDNCWYTEVCLSKLTNTAEQVK